MIQQILGGLKLRVGQPNLIWLDSRLMAMDIYVMDRTLQVLTKLINTAIRIILGRLKLLVERLELIWLDSRLMAMDISVTELLVQ